MLLRSGLRDGRSQKTREEKRRCGKPSRPDGREAVPVHVTGLRGLRFVPFRTWPAQQHPPKPAAARVHMLFILATISPCAHSPVIIQCHKPPGVGLSTTTSLSIITMIDETGLSRRCACTNGPFADSRRISRFEQACFS